MIEAFREQLGTFKAFGAVMRNPNLRRLELAWAGSVTGFWGYSIALAVFAYQQGGAGAVGLVGVIRMGPAALAAPFSSSFADRYRREHALLVAALVRAAAIGTAAAGIWADFPAGVIYALAGVEALSSTVFRPAQAALVPSLATTPDEATAANVVASTVEAVGIFAGPALGGLLLAAAGAGATFAATAAVFLLAALLASRIRYELPPEQAATRTGGGIVRESLEGFRTIAVERKLRVVVGLYGAQTLVAGALNVLIVVSALDLLDIGKSGVGFLNSAIGIGGILGGIGALALVGRGKLAADFGIGLLLWGAPIALIGIFPSPALVIVFLALAGVGVTVADVAGVTLLQRAVSDEVMARVFGVLQTVFVGTIGLGAVLAPLLISAFGIRAALVVTGALVPVLTVLLWRQLAVIDASASVPSAELELLRKVPFFAPLPPPALELLASNLVEVRVPAGTEVFRQGDRGDRFYIVKDGEVEIDLDGRVASQGPGSYFGEIALLRDVPRTATVRAKTDVELYALERHDFIGAVTGHPSSHEAADAVISTRLGPAGFAST